MLAHVSLPNTYFFQATWDPVGQMIRDFHKDVQTCGDTVDANCKCGSEKVKVYDKDNDAFHCYDEPPADGCPKWDQTFDFDLSVWACVTRPFDDDPVEAAKRLKNCMGPGVVGNHWSLLEDLLEYDSTIPAGGQAPCSMVGGNPVPSAVMINPDEIIREARRIGASPWQVLADVLIHESYHLEDYFKYDYCWRMWTRFGYAMDLRKGNYTVDEPGMEDYTNDRTFKEYRSQFGVRAAHDPNYRAATDGDLSSCPLL